MSNKKLDLVGEKYGRLTVTKEADKAPEGKRMVRAWHVMCDCGNQFSTKQSNLRRGKVKSCGCINKDKRDLTNKRYGKLVAIERCGKKKYGKANEEKTMWRCVCDCGNESIVEHTNLTSGNTKSCGCLISHRVRIRNIENSAHGLSKHPLYNIWRGFIDRCTNSNSSRYRDYGGRGITICKSWAESPVKFIKWAETKGGWEPDKGLSLDRIDVNGNYEPSNCRFTNDSIQAINRRANTNNSSGYHGVSKRSNGKWRARITFEGNLKDLGTYDNLLDAVEARQLAEIEILGYLADSEPISQKVIDALQSASQENNLN